MSFDKKQITDFTERILKRSGMYSHEALDQMLKTLAQESHFGTYLYQRGGGPAKGPWQVEVGNEKDIWKNYLTGQSGLVTVIREITGVTGPNPDALEGDLRYNLIMARITYRRKKPALPPVGATIEQAHYWKKHYNTFSGKGTIEEFIANSKKYLGV